MKLWKLLSLLIECNMHSHCPSPLCWYPNFLYTLVDLGSEDYPRYGELGIAWEWVEPQFLRPIPPPTYPDPSTKNAPWFRHKNGLGSLPF